MPEAMFQKIIDDLAVTKPRRVSLYLMNEPMADKRMPSFIQYVNERLPKTTTLITTNGTYLTEERLDAYIDAGLKRIKISLQSLDDDKNKQLMGYGSDKVVENILNAQRLIKKKRAHKFDLRVSMLVTAVNGAEIDETRRFWKKNGVRLVTSALENRGGNISDASGLNVGEMKPMGDCIRPSREMCILFNGDVALCCVDWHRTVVAGNVWTEPVTDVWNSPVYREIRSALKTGDAGHLPPICVDCSESACPNNHRRGLKGMVSRLVGAGSPTV
jgi:MoaA/NifB/PqqE/SkfB family radical SAM enzyme